MYIFFQNNQYLGSYYLTGSDDDPVHTIGLKSFKTQSFHLTQTKPVVNTLMPTTSTAITCIPTLYLRICVSSRSTFRYNTTSYFLCWLIPEVFCSVSSRAEAASCRSTDSARRETSMYLCQSQSSSSASE